LELTQVKHLSGTPLKKAPGHHTNFRIGWKDLPGEIYLRGKKICKL